MTDARLLITTLDTTTILQGLALNFPTILICDLKKLNINEDYFSYYKILHDAKILFHDFSEAKFHIEKHFLILRMVEKQCEAREIFCKKFAYHPQNQPTYFVKKLSEIKLVKLFKDFLVIVFIPITFFLKIISPTIKVRWSKVYFPDR